MKKVYVITITNANSSGVRVENNHAVFSDKERAEKEVQTIINGYLHELRLFYQEDSLIVENTKEHGGTITVPTGEAYVVAVEEHILV